MNSFIFNGRSSRDFGLTVEKAGVAAKPNPRITKVTVPGSSRDFYYLEEGYDNINISYRVWCMEPEKDMVLDRLGEIMRWLGTDTYVVLSDTYDPEHFRLARCVSGLDPELLLRRAARQEITFSCDPYRYLWAGEETVEAEILAGQEPTVSLHNPTGIPALPEIRIQTTGSATYKLLIIGDTETPMWTLTSSGPETTLDSDRQQTFQNGLNANNNKSGEGYPVLMAGESNIYATTEGATAKVSKITVKPRWREL